MYAASYAPNGAMIATGGFDHTVKLWEAATGRELRTLEGHQNIVLSLAVSPDGFSVVSGANDNTLKLWDLPSDKPLASWEGHEAAVNAVAVSSDGRLVISAGEDKAVRVWQRADGKLLQTLTGHDADILRVAIRTDVRQWASADSTGRIRLWTPGQYLDEDPTIPSDLFAHVGPVTGIRFHPNNQLLLTAGEDGAIIQWQLPIGVPRIVARTPATPPAENVAPAEPNPVATSIERVALTVNGQIGVVRRRHRRSARWKDKSAPFVHWHSVRITR